jgi:NADH:ubiquinone oxidoreductase subunit
MRYVAATLTRESQIALYNSINDISPIPGDWTRYCHHMTIRFNPSSNDLIPEPNVPVKITATEYAADNQGIAVKVECHPDREKLFVPKEQLLHITVAVAPGVSPVYSNTLLRRGTLLKLPQAINLNALTWIKHDNGTSTQNGLALENFR